MSEEARIEQLLGEVLDSGRSPEEVCARAPELLWEVRERWERCRDVEAQIESMFPTTDPGRDARRWPHLPTVLPDIAGYQVEAVLGRGGMGVVYKARHLKLNRPVAIKMLLCGPYAAAADLASLTREAEAVAGLNHEHIVQVHDVGDLDGLPYYTMEFVEGGCLARRLCGIPQPAAEAAAMLLKLARAVHAAHRGGVVHRDLKPSNILLSADGEPKITDFGLARHVGDDRGATPGGGGRGGTPSYMAPEQALGRPTALDPAVDVYALGAILYEMLTGRPPFQAESASETRRQSIAQEPVPPSRLNARVPRDLETICLKCLRKDPAHRYASAAALADDLSRYRDGLPILARPVGPVGRAWRWARRKPAAAALVVTALASLALAAGGWTWVHRQQAIARAETTRQQRRTWQAVETALLQAAALREQGHWPEVRAALKAAPDLLGGAAPPALRERLQRARADADMVVALEEIRLRMSEGRKAHELDLPTADARYGDAFAGYDIDLRTLAPDEAAARLRRSAIHSTLVGFLHDWLYWASETNRGKVASALDRADDDPWRRAYRRAMPTWDPGKHKALATAPEALAQPPVVLSGLGGILLHLGLRDEAWSLLRSAQQRHPGDFWINFMLGQFLEQERPQEAVGYFRAAVAVRPTSDRAYSKLARVLRDAGDADGAIAATRAAIALSPGGGGAKDLAKLLAARGELEEARVTWAAVLERDPPDYEPWYGYAQLCLFLDEREEYVRARKALLDRFGTSNNWVIAERSSLASLLLPATGDDLRRAVALADKAVATGPKAPHPDRAYLQFVKGLAEYRQHHLDNAVRLLGESAERLPNRAGPRLALAMAQFRSGSTSEARRTLATAVRNQNWNAPSADHPTSWISHVLRREAEAMILPNLPAFLRGEYRPRDNDERLALLGICQFEGRHAAAAGLFADAFSADPELADRLTAECLRRAARESIPIDRVEVLNAECRYLAARCAALAGCGLAKDGTNLGDAERRRWREQACEWMRADLTAWIRLLEGDSPSARDVIRRMLTLWQAEPDLAPLRDRAKLENVPADEREEWTAFWNDVRVTLEKLERA